MDCILPSSSIHGILQARILEWVAISFSRGSSRPRDHTWVSRIAGRCFTLWATREALTAKNDLWIDLLRGHGALLPKLWSSCREALSPLGEIPSSLVPEPSPSRLSCLPSNCSFSVFWGLSSSAWPQNVGTLHSSLPRSFSHSLYFSGLHSNSLTSHSMTASISISPTKAWNTYQEAWVRCSPDTSYSTGLSWCAQAAITKNHGMGGVNNRNLFLTVFCRLESLRSKCHLTEFLVRALFLAGSVPFSSVAQSHPTLRPHGLQHARPSCPSPTPGAYSNSCSLSWWCHLTISYSVIPCSSHLQSFPASGTFLMRQFFASGGQSIGASASASVLPGNIQVWFPFGWTGWISLQSKGLSRVFNTTVQKHWFFSAQLSL